MRHAWFNALPGDTTASRRRWWTFRARVGFVVELAVVGALWTSIVGHHPWLTLINFSTLIVNTHSVLIAHRMLKKLNRLEALEAALAVEDGAGLVRALLDAKD